MRKPLVACVAFTMVALAAGCGGGGSGGVTPPLGSGGSSAGSARSAVTIAIPPNNVFVKWIVPIIVALSLTFGLSVFVHHELDRQEAAKKAQ